MRPVRRRERSRRRLADELDDIARHCARLPVHDGRPADEILLTRRRFSDEKTRERFAASCLLVMDLETCLRQGAGHVLPLRWICVGRVAYH